MAAKPRLIDEIKQQHQRRQSRYCGVGTALQLLGVEADDLRQALENAEFTARAISDALAGRGINVHRDVIVRHRRGDCKCES